MKIIEQRLRKIILEKFERCLWKNISDDGNRATIESREDQLGTSSCTKSSTEARVNVVDRPPANTPTTEVDPWSHGLVLSSMRPHPSNRKPEHTKRTDVQLPSRIGENSTPHHEGKLHPCLEDAPPQEMPTRILPRERCAPRAFSAPCTDNSGPRPPRWPSIHYRHVRFSPFRVSYTYGTPCDTRPKCSFVDRPR